MSCGTNQKKEQCFKRNLQFGKRHGDEYTIFLLQKTIRAVLDSLKVDGDNGVTTVYVKPLEEDGKGLEPKDDNFNYRHRTVFHNLTHSGKVNRLALIPIFFVFVTLKDLY